VPFCETCARHWTPPSLRADGTCPTCGAHLGDAPALAADAGQAAPAAAVAGSHGDEAHRKVPWHFTLLLIALVLYLGFRAYQGIAWLIVHVF
jgi:hypothetical protein